MTMILNIENLSYPCVTRTRARDAASKLLSQIDNAPIVVYLDNVEILSLSFLDEFIFYLAASANMKNVVFQTVDPLLLDKLARVAAIRHVKIRYETDDNNVNILKPKPSPLQETRFVPSKTLLS